MEKKHQFLLVVFVLLFAMAMGNVFMQCSKEKADVSKRLHKLENPNYVEEAPAPAGE
jgi:hypothetical protein